MMNRLLNSLNHWFEQFPELLHRHRWWVTIGFIALTTIVAFGITRVKLDMSLEVYFQKDEPVKQAYDRFRAVFGGDETVFIIYEANDGDIFSEASLRALKGVHEDLLNYRWDLGPDERSPLDHVTEIRSLINVNYLETLESALISRQFIGDRLPHTEQEREALRSLALEHPDYPSVYLSEDSKYGGIILRTDFNARIVEEVPDISNLNATATPSKSLTPEADILDEDDVADVLDEDDVADVLDEDDVWELDSEIVEIQDFDETYQPQFQKTEFTEYTPFVDALMAILNKPEYTEALTFHPVGNPVLMGELGQMVQQELGTVTGGALLLILVMSWLLFRSGSAVVWPMVVVILSMVWIVGLIGWSGVAMTSMISIIVFLVLAVGVADAIHILSGYLFFRNQQQDHATALRSVYQKTGLACFLTSMTTGIGLLALLFVPIVPIQSFGMFSAVGVLLAFVFTVLLLPLLLDLWKPVSKKQALAITKAGMKSHLILRGIHRIEQWGIRYAKAFIAGFALIGILLSVGIFQIRVNSDMIQNIKEGVPIRERYDLVNEFMGGTDSMEILVDLGESNAMKDPEVLNAIEALQDQLQSVHGDIVIKTSSLVNVAKDAFKTLNEGRPEMYRIPQERRLLEQTLFLFNNANPQDRRQLVSDDYRMGRIGINMRNIGSEKAVELTESVKGSVHRMFTPLQSRYPELEVTLTGQLSLILLLTDFISWSQVQSFGLALVVISVLLLGIFGSKRIGLIAVLPNVFPVLTIFGLMGYLGIPLDSDTLLIAPIIIGIAVDDTIHFLTHYRAELLQHGNNAQAIILTIREVGQAVVFTTIILAMGFLMFILSIQEGLSHFGIFSATALVAALLADLFLLPALLTVFPARIESGVPNAELSNSP